MRAVFLLIALLQLAVGIVPAGWVVCLESGGAIALEAAGGRCCDGDAGDEADACRDVPLLDAAPERPIVQAELLVDSVSLACLEFAATLDLRSLSTGGHCALIGRRLVPPESPHLVLRL